MIDELTIYNLAVIYPNTVDLVREVEMMTIDEFATKIYEEFDKCHGRMALIQFENVMKQMRRRNDRD